MNINFKSVKILGVPYAVHSISQQEIAQLAGNQNTVGLCDDLEDNLYISKELKGRAEKKIFIHEWTHGVKGVMGLNQTIDERTAECICQSFANAILELLEQKEVMKFLMKK